MKTCWVKKPLGELCQVVGGGTPAKGNLKYYTGNIPWASVRDMRSELIDATEFKITQQAVKESSTNIIPGGNVIIATRVGLGKVCLLKQDTAINQDLRGIIPKDTRELSVRYLFLWLKSISHLIVAEGTGATVQGVKLPFVKSLQIPVPPLDKQRRIVGVLDEAFAGIATAKVNAEKNLQNSREIAESYLSDIFNATHHGWESKRLGECFRLKSGEMLQSRCMNKAGEFNVYGGNGISGKHDRCNLEGSNVIVGRVGALCGNVRHVQEPIWLTDNAFYVTDFVSNFDHKFLTYLLNFKNLRTLARQAAQPVISNSSIGAADLCFPAKIEEQKNIVDKLDKLHIETKHLECIYQQKLANLEELKKSILQKAFNGELVGAKV